MSDTTKQYLTNVRLDADDQRLLQLLSEQEKLPRSEIIRRSIRALAERDLKPRRARKQPAA